MHLSPNVHFDGCSKKFLHTEVKYFSLRPCLGCNSCSPCAKPHPCSLSRFSQGFPPSQNLHNSVRTFDFHFVSDSLDTVLFKLTDCLGNSSSKSDKPEEYSSWPFSQLEPLVLAIWSLFVFSHSFKFSSKGLHWIWTG